MAQQQHHKKHQAGGNGNNPNGGGGGGGSGGGTPQPMSHGKKNALSRVHVLKNAKNMIQLNNSQTLTSPTLANSNIITFTPKNIGLLKRFYVEVVMTFTTAAGTTSCALTPFGPANIISNIQFIDFQNQARINCTGWHLIAVNTVRAGASSPLASAETSDTPLGYTNVLGAISAPATVAASTAATVKMVFEVPIAYSDTDLRGAIYMATTGANTSLNLTLNPSIFVLNTADPTQGVYAYAGTVPTVNTVVVNFYQNYLDQIPLIGGRVVLPELDLNTIYQLQTSNYSGFSVNNPFGIPYSNLRQFLSTTLVYDNNGLNAGTDITNIGLQVANNTFIWQMDTQLISYLTRKMINADTPKGMYYFDHRRDPIDTDQFGNVQLVVTASSVNTGAVMFMGFEFFSTRTTVMKSQSLPSG